MTEGAKSANITNRQIALLHVAKRELRLSDETYRDILLRFGNCESARELDAYDFEYVMKYFTALGFRSTWTKRTFGNRRDMATPAQVELMRSLWQKYAGELDANDVRLNEWLSRFYKVSALRFVDARKASKVITALKAMAGRK